MKKLAIFASGEGTNAQNIIDFFKSSVTIKIALIVSNKSQANVLSRAKAADIPYYIISREDFYITNRLLDVLHENSIDWIVLAGFLWLIPDNLIHRYPRRIINIHPSLLPKYGGKGMYGSRVHEAVIAAKEKESGITIHYVDGEYDKGQIIFQAKCSVDSTDTSDLLAQKIHDLEKKHLPQIIQKLV